MGKGLPRSMARGAAQRQEVIKQTFTFTNVAVSVAGASGVGWGTAVIGDFPEGNILFLGATSYVTVTGPGSASLDDTWDGDYSVGTTPTADATISGTDANIIGSSPFGAATAEVSPNARGTGATVAVFDNTDGSLELNLNVLVDDANISATVAMTASGTVTVLYAMMGDD